MSLLSVFPWSRVILLLIFIILAGCWLPQCAAVQCVGAKKPCSNTTTCVPDKSGVGDGSCQMTYSYSSLFVPSGGCLLCSCPVDLFADKCHSRDSCCPEPCHNGGTCQHTSSKGYRCDCLPGFTGAKCETDIVDCVGRSCQNGGICLNSVNGYSCQCKSGWTGQHCVDDVDECLLFPNPCQNGGTCINNNGSYSCLCVNGWAEPNCSMNIDDCAKAPCEAGSTCVDHVGAFTCSCPYGKAGLLCNLTNSCVSNPCRGSSMCELDFDGSFRCVCPKGLKGDLCEQDIDECAEGANPCEHDGKCINIHGSFTCICPRGQTGQRCENYVEPCLPSPCLNGATCKDMKNEYECLCNSGFSGKHCETKVDVCASSPCMNRGHCLDLGSYFTCRCRPGFSGLRCEKNVSKCEPNPCGRGLCREDNTGYTCHCPPGMTGRLCDSPMDPCLSHPCHVGAICSKNTSAPEGYTCACQPGSSGPDCGQLEPEPCAHLRCLNEGHCQVTLTGRAQCICPTHYSGRRCETFDPGVTRGHCPDERCVALAGNLACDPSCNRAECAWDGGDCSLGWRPWRDCPPERRCWELIHNGRCDSLCNVAECLFDGFECQPAATPCRYEKYCADYFASGHCDQGCNTKECGWDGLDCADDVSSHLAHGWLVLVVQAPPEALLRDRNRLLRELGALLRTNLRVRLDDQNQPMIYPYHGPQQGKAVVPQKLNTKAAWSKVYLEVINHECSAQSEGVCFLTAEQAASFIAAEYQDTPLSFPIFSVKGVPQKSTPQVHLLYLVAVGVLILLLVLGALAAKRRRKHGALWLPEGFLIKGPRRREPVGQDELDLTDIMKPKEGAVVHASDEQAWLQPKKPKMEDKALLPNGSDSGGAGDDLRDWTPQHWKAADLAPTPPQVEMDINCMDVNVKGPDGLTPLMLASLRHGVSPDCDSPLGEELEEGGGAQEPGPDVISDLVALGAMLQARTEATGETALHLAARFSRADATKRLLDAGADANARDHMGRTPLHTAVAADAQGVFQILIRNRATDLNARMNDGTTATILATRLAVEGMVQQLVHCHADVNAVDSHGKSALHWAAAVNNVEAALVLVKNGANRDLQNNKEETPLFLAAREGSFDVARILLDHCCSREIADHLDRLPRDIAQERMHHDIVQLLDHYNLAPSPHVEHDRMAGAPPHTLHHAPLACSNVLSDLRPRPQAKKGRRGGGGRAAGERPGKEAKDPKAKRRKRMGGAAPGGKPGDGSAPAGEGLSGEGSGTLSPPDSLESPHAFAADAAASSQSVTSSLPLATPRINRPLLPPVSQMLARQQQVCWTEQGAHGYRARSTELLPRHFGVSQPAVAQCYQKSHLAPLPPALAYQMMAQEMDQGQEEVLYHPQEGTSIPQCISARTFPLSTLGGADESPLTYSLGLGGTALSSSLHRHERCMEKYPELVSQCSYPSGRLEGAAPSVRPRPPAEHPYLTPSPESLDPWSCSSSPSSHSISDWSEVTTSPASLPTCHTHMPNPPHPQQPPHSSMHTHS